MSTKDKKLSEQISEFLNLLNAVAPSYQYAYDKVGEQDKLTQDILHSLELENLKYNERAKLATQLQQVRRSRRGYRDMVEELEPIAEFAKNNKKFLDMLRQCLGEVRKQEKYHENRRYFPRIIKQSEGNRKE